MTSFALYSTLNEMQKLKYGFSTKLHPTQKTFILHYYQLSTQNLDSDVSVPETWKESTELG